MDEAEALRQVDEALAQRGFKRDWTRPRPLIWRGALAVGDKDYPISVTIPDFDFVRLPEIAVADPKALPLRALPHFFEGDAICYLDPSTAVLDRYDPAGTVLRCLKHAHKVLADSITGVSDADFVAEFTAYWKGTIYVDLPPDFNDTHARICWLSLMDENPQTTIGVIASKGSIDASLLARHRRISGASKFSSQPCAVAAVKAPLTVHPGDWPAPNLEQFARWLGRFAPDANAAITRALALNGERKVLALRAPNGWFVAEFEIPPAYRKPGFTSRKSSFPQIIMAVAKNVPIRRFSGFRMDAEYVYRRNMAGMKNLSGKKIAVVGCGTIGGFLAHALAQSGAGTQSGELHLFDSDALQPANLGRHVLGVQQLGKPKAEALRLFLVEQLPHIDVRARIGNVLDEKERLLRYDLVIDATGEEALSIALNHYFVSNRPKAPAILFVWLLGNGAAAQAIICVESQFSCLKCLKPALGGKPRFPILKEEAVVVRNLACGDAAYIPFPVSRSMQAAALALEVALDWANERPRPYFRTRVFDERKAFHVKDQNPAPSPQCPVCSAR